MSKTVSPTSASTRTHTARRDIAARAFAAVALLAAVAATGTAVARAARAGSAEPVPPADLIFVTDGQTAHNPDDPGCYQVLAINAATGGWVDRSVWKPTPGRLAATSDASLVVAVLAGDSYGRSWVVVMVRTPGERMKWFSKDIAYSVPDGGPVAISPDDQTMLIAMKRPEVEKHKVGDISINTLGRPTGTLAGVTAAEIVFSPDSLIAYLIDLDGLVHVVDVATMSEAVPPIPYTPVRAPHAMRLRNTFASMSPDGRYLVVNTRWPNVNVVDVVERRTTLVDTPGLDATYDLEFSYSAPQENLLAVHGHRAVAVYHFRGTDALEPLALTPISGQVWPDIPVVPAEDERSNTLAWTGRGDGVVAAIAGDMEYRILDWEPGPPAALRKRLDFNSCWQTRNPETFGLQVDVITINKPGIARTPTPSPTSAPSPSTTREPATPPSTPTSSATATVPPTTTPSACPTPTPTASRTPGATATRAPEPVYLPVALRELCTPGQQRVDVALAIDASTSMEERTNTEQTKLEAALDAARAFLHLMRPDAGDQAAIVAFNESAALLAPLTDDLGILHAALRAINTAERTCLVCAVDVAATELAAERHRAASTPVLILLTDGKSNPRPASEAVARAAEAKRAGVIVFAVGLGSELDDDALEAIASRPSYFFRAPTADQLVEIYRRIAIAIPCPAEDSWRRQALERPITGGSSGCGECGRTHLR